MPIADHTAWLYNRLKHVSIEIICYIIDLGLHNPHRITVLLLQSMYALKVLLKWALLDVGLSAMSTGNHTQPDTQRSIIHAGLGKMYSGLSSIFL